MAEASIPVDLFNPGQVFACLGFMEAADVLLGPSEATFDWRTPNEARFHLRARGDQSPFEHVLQFISTAQAHGEAPEGSANIDGWGEGWGPLRSRARDRGYPFRDPESPATLVCVLESDGRTLEINHWGDDSRRTRDNVKFWAGAGGMPGVALARDALDLVRQHAVSVADDPFAFAAPQSSSFRLDWRRDYIPIDAGFSLNRHGGKIATVGFPLVELLGAIGLSHARPLARSKLDYGYAVVGCAADSLTWLPPLLLRAALGMAPLPFPTRRFQMLLGWPGKEGQARSITTVTEELAQ